MTDKYYCKIHAKKQSLKIPSNELKKNCIMKAKLGELKALCEKYDFIKEKSKKKMLKTDYQKVILSELNNHYFEFVSTVKTSSINMVTYGIRMKQGFENLLKDEKIDRIIKRLKAELNPVKIILFGSYASGAPREDSDLDLLIVAETDLPPVERFALVSRMLADFPVAFDIVFKTPLEYDRWRKVINNIVYFADRYGRVVYEQ